jgi:NTE family protein
MFVDGGVLNPLPTVPVLSDSSDLTIAVNLNGEDSDEAVLPRVAKMDSIKEKALGFIRENFFSKKEEGLDAVKILHLSLEAMQNLITRYELAAHQPDLIIDIPGNTCEVYDFHRAKEMIAYGKRAAAAVLDEYEEKGAKR